MTPEIKELLVRLKEYMESSEADINWYSGGVPSIEEIMSRGLMPPLYNDLCRVLEQNP